MWNGLKLSTVNLVIVRGFVEGANRDIEDIPFSWMEENCTSKWSEGLRFVQVRKKQCTLSWFKMLAVRSYL